MEVLFIEVVMMSVSLCQAGSNMLVEALLCCVIVLLVCQSCLLCCVARGLIVLGPTKMISESGKTQTHWEKTETEHQDVKLVGTPRKRHSPPGQMFVAPTAGEKYHLDRDCIQLKGAKAVKPYVLCRNCERMHR